MNPILLFLEWFDMCMYVCILVFLYVFSYSESIFFLSLCLYVWIYVNGHDSVQTFFIRLMYLFSYKPDYFAWYLNHFKSIFQPFSNQRKPINILFFNTIIQLNIFIAHVHLMLIHQSCFTRIWLNLVKENLKKPRKSTEN